MEQERYSRQTMLPEIGTAGQERLSRARVAVIGVGGLGSAASVYLAGAGVGHLLLADPDVVSLSNLQRQVLYTEAEMGQPKAQCAARRLNAINSSIVIDACTDGLTEANGLQLLTGIDLVIDCTDNHPTRYLIDDLCHELSIPWVYGSIGEFAGQVGVMNHNARCRYSDLFPERDELCSRPHFTQGVLGAVPGVIGAIQACEALKLITSCSELLDGKIFTIDLKTMNTETFQF